VSRRFNKLDVKSLVLSQELHLILLNLMTGGGIGIPSVEVKFVDIWRNTRSEGVYLAC